MSSLNRIPKFGRRRTVLNPKHANALRKVFQCLLNAKIVRGGSNRAVWGDENLIFEIKR